MDVDRVAMVSKESELTPGLCPVLDFRLTKSVQSISPPICPTRLYSCSYFPTLEDIERVLMTGISETYLERLVEYEE